MRSWTPGERHSVPEYWRWYLLLTMLSALAWRSQTNAAPRVWFGTSLDGEVMMREDGGEATFALPVPEGAALVALGLPLRLNSASAQALEGVPGIGPRTASKIVESRRESGCFPRLSALTRVRGIGPMTVAKIAPYLEVRDPQGRGCAVARHG